MNKLDKVITIHKEDIYKFIYFIVCIVQKNELPMRGALSSRSDMIGEIFDMDKCITRVYCF